jgi:hypothetical protein
MPTGGCCSDEIEPLWPPALARTNGAAIDISTSTNSSAGRSPRCAPGRVGVADRVNRLPTHGASVRPHSGRAVPRIPPCGRRQDRSASRRSLCTREPGRTRRTGRRSRTMTMRGVRSLRTSNPARRTSAQWRQVALRRRRGSWMQSSRPRVAWWGESVELRGRNGRLITARHNASGVLDGPRVTRLRRACGARGS